MKKSIKFLALILFIAVASACTSTPSVVTPAVVPTPFEGIYNSAVNTNFPDTPNAFNGADIQEYTFQMSVAGAITSFEYQSRLVLTTDPYEITVIDNVSNTIVYNGKCFFSKTASSSFSVTPISLLANRSYTLRRIALPIATAGVDSSGRGVYTDTTLANMPFVYPVNVGIMQVTSTRMVYSLVSGFVTKINEGIPFINFTYL